MITGFLKEGQRKKMKKIINDANQVVDDMLAGMEAVNPEICYDREGEVIYRRKKAEKVGIVSGGGSGHEPAHAGYVGAGMLDAAVAGNVFASPDPAKILNGIQRSDSGQGVLLVIKNYSGDIMNFEMAADLAADMGIPVRSVIVRDDVAVKESTYSTGRRGIAGTVFVHKIAGAKAESGGSLEEVAELAQRTADNVRSFGVSLSGCILPGAGTPGFVIGETQMELFILVGEIDRQIRAKNITPVKYLVGNFMTSLEMAGASMSMLRLDEEMKNCLTAPCNTMAWKEG